ncbi:hypothetical protein S245_071001 [Arachis hypogaea]
MKTRGTMMMFFLRILTTCTVTGLAWLTGMKRWLRSTIPDLECGRGRGGGEGEDEGRVVGKHESKEGVLDGVRGGGEGEEDGFVGVKGGVDGEGASVKEEGARVGFEE